MRPPRRTASTSDGDLTTKFSSGDATQLVYFKTVSGLSLAYQTLLVGRRLPQSSSTPRPARCSTATASRTPRTASPGTTAPARSPAARSTRSTSTARAAPGASEPSTRSSARTPGSRATTSGCTATSTAATARASSELIRNDGTGNFNYAFTPFTNTTQLAVHGGISVLVELALPGRRVLLGHEPEAERHAGRTSSSTPSTTTCWPRRSASPRPPATSSSSTRRARARPATRSSPRPTTARTRSASSRRPHGDARRQPHRQRELQHAARRLRAADADVPLQLAVRARRVPPGERRRRGERRLPRVHARPLEPARRRRRRQLDARQHPGRLDGRGVERLVRARTSSSTRAS